MYNILLIVVTLFASVSCVNKQTNDSGAITQTAQSDSINATNVVDIQTEFKDIDVAEAKKLMLANPKIVLLDVRTPEEIAQGKIENAIELDIYDSAFDSKLNKMDKNKKYIVYCAVGGRSKSAEGKMKSLGFQSVYNLKGGYRAWKNQ